MRPSLAPWKLQQIPWYFLLRLGNKSPRVTLNHKPASIHYWTCPPLHQLWPADPFSGRWAEPLLFLSLTHLSLRRCSVWPHPGSSRGVRGEQNVVGFLFDWYRLMMVLCSLGQQVGKSGSFLGHMESPSDGSVWVGGIRSPCCFLMPSESLPQWPLPGLPPPLPTHVNPFAARVSHSDRPLTIFSN